MKHVSLQVGMKGFGALALMNRAAPAILPRAAAPQSIYPIGTQYLLERYPVFDFIKAHPVIHAV